MKIKKEKSKADNFADSIKDNPSIRKKRQLINWARAEIREYEKLIKILEKEL